MTRNVRIAFADFVSASMHLMVSVARIMASASLLDMLIIPFSIYSVEPACGGDPEVAYLAYAFPYRNRHRDTGNGLYTVPIHLSHLCASGYISAVYYLLNIFFFTFQKTPSRSPRPRSRAFAFCACSYYIWVSFISACCIRLQPRQRTFFKVCIRSSQSFHYICITLVLQRYNSLSYLQ